MNRRHLLSALSAGALSSAFLHLGCSKDDGGDPADRERKLAFDALARAKVHGKPLLVFVVPKDPGIWTRGTLLGSWLAHADDALLADLALFEIVCVPLNEIAGLSIRELALDQEPLMVCIETHEATPRAIAIDGNVPEELWQRSTQHDPKPPEDVAGAMERAIGERDALVSTWLRDTLRLDERLPQLAHRVDATLSDAERASIAAHVGEPSRLEAALVLRAAAVLRQRAKDAGPAVLQAVTAAIAQAAAPVHKIAPPAGALWARHTGCGTELEDPLERAKVGEPGVLCGMGAIAESSARFLDFFTNRGK